MYTFYLGRLLGAVSFGGLLVLAACSSEGGGAQSTADAPAVAMAVAPDTATLHVAANGLAALVAEELHVADTATQRRIRAAFHRRAHLLALADQRHHLDTTGFYAAARYANDVADREINTVLGDGPTYRAYLRHRPTYYAGTPFRVAVATEARGRGPAVVKREVEQDGDVKIKYADGTKVKIDAEDGDRKVKHPNGLKVKTDGDDGARKVKN